MPVFLYDSSQRAQGLICFPGIGEGGGNIRFQDYNGASHSVPGCELVGRATLEVVLRKNLIGVDAISGHTTTDVSRNRAATVRERTLKVDLQGSKRRCLETPNNTHRSSTFD